jgi:hypothetical protein
MKLATKTTGLRRSFPLALAASLLVLGAPAAVALAVGTTLWQLDTAQQLEQGELEHVVLSSLGEMKLGRSATRIALDDVALVWSVAEAPDGAVYLGTGNNGAVLRLRGAKVEEVARLDGLVVSALAVGEGGAIYAGTMPGGKIYRLDGKAPALGGGAGAKGTKGATKAAAPAVLATLDRAEDVWALQWDSKRGVLFAATGPEGLVYSVSPAGRAEVYYDAADDHALSLLLTEPGGDVLAGTSPGARLLRITGPGRAFALHDFEATEVSGIARRGDDLYLAVNTFPDPPEPPATGGAKVKTELSKARPKPGKGKIFRRRPDGSLEPLLEFADGHLTSIQALDDGLVYAGTGGKGRIVAVGDDRVTYTIADVEERQVLALALAGRDPVFATGDTGAVYRLGAAAPGLAEYSTPPIDAAFVSRWGRIEWRGRGRLELQTRSGNTEEPDATWSDWSAPIATSGSPVASPPARYLQVRVRWARDPGAVLRALGGFYLPGNQRPVVTEVEADSPFVVIRPEVKAKAKAATPPEPATKSATPAPDAARSSVLKLRWKVDNPDDDPLRYRLFFREESEPDWRPILPSDKVLSTTSFDWNTEAVPAGRYLIKVEASDELDNPAPRSARSEKLSPPIVIDNQPPRVENVAAKGRTVTGRAIDAFSPIQQIQYSLDGLQWSPVAPVDAILDSRDEPFSFELPAALPAGSYTVAVQVFDRARNSATGRVVASVR